MTNRPKQKTAPFGFSPIKLDCFDCEGRRGDRASFLGRGVQSHRSDLVRMVSSEPCLISTLCARARGLADKVTGGSFKAAARRRALCRDDELSQWHNAVQKLNVPLM